MSFFSKLFSKKSAKTKFTNVVVGRILAVEAHPNADRLRVATVSTGAEPLQIVCGAPNIAPEQLVPVALVGATLPGGMTINQAKIRGIDSFGMICAADELGLGGDHSGIMILTGGTPGEAIDAHIPELTN